MKTLFQALLSLLAVTIMLSPLVFGAYQLSQTWFDAEDAAASTTADNTVVSSHPLLEIPLNQNEPSKLNISPFSEPLVSVTFDDGWQGIYTNGLPLLEKYGINTSQFIISDLIGDPAYMSFEQITQFQHGRHEIGGHTATHADLTTVGISELKHELVDSHTQLEAQFGQIDGFASPYGAYDNQALGVIKQHYSYHRTTSWPFINTSDNYNRYKILAFTVRTSTSIDEINSLIRLAQQQNGWLVLVYHDVIIDGGEFSVTPQTFESHLQLITDQGLKSPTIDEVVDSIEARS